MRDPDFGERFEVRRKLGEGGFGAVFEVFDRERGELVALKSLTRLDPASLHRFKHADLGHPNLVRLHELSTEGEHWFFTMELLRGSTWLDFVRPASVGAPAASVAMAATEDASAPELAPTVELTATSSSSSLAPVTVERVRHAPDHRADPRRDTRPWGRPPRRKAAERLRDRRGSRRFPRLRDRDERPGERRRADGRKTRLSQPRSDRANRDGRTLQPHPQSVVRRPPGAPVPALLRELEKRRRSLQPSRRSPSEPPPSVERAAGAAG